MKLLDDFKAFAMRGNVIDLAVGVVIGAAFGKIVNSLVNDIIMPPIGMLINGVKFTDLKFKLKEATVDETGKAVDAVTVNYGNFIQMTFEFVIVAFAIFMMVRIMNKLHLKKDQVKPPAVPTAEEKLLMEIRDTLKEKKI